MESRALIFGALLKQYWVARGLTQEEVAERAEISPRGLMYLEHGQRLPYQDTLRRFMNALDLSDEQRLQLQNAARASRIPPLSELLIEQGMPPLLVAPGPLFGREQAVASAMEFLRQSSIRLLTLRKRQHLVFVVPRDEVRSFFRFRTTYELIGVSRPPTYGVLSALENLTRDVPDSLNL
ncbi:hypothetical protein KSF_111710 [Reticulibacter mediterranei]|uniref:HTH cro/C1-type domain-containing protein n=1 Tax=Reticulibacter mediterranei TaxID=2778369 RepID=A0A8J3N9S7_9CHLR|nr:helix-turn-helix transcriptional regulator [Reticulibacter mediterranei]GHP01124.1 hypothetical protein KSF_111710 [Reticulibacter mediterranei]